MKTFEFDLQQVDQLLSTTRSVRRRLDFDRPVENEVLLDCLRLATFSPSAGNTQLWRWIVVTDPEKRKQIADLYWGLFTGMQDGGVPYDTSDPAIARMISASTYLGENMHRVPAMVFPCYLETAAPGAPNVQLASLYGSIVQAAWSFQLALRSRGLGSVWTTMHLFKEQEVAEILGIPEGITQVAMLPVAYTVGTDFSPPPRRPVEEVTYWNEWPAEGEAQ